MTTASWQKDSASIVSLGTSASDTTRPHNVSLPPHTVNRAVPSEIPKRAPSPNMPTANSGAMASSSHAPNDPYSKDNRSSRSSHQTLHESERPLDEDSDRMNTQFYKSSLGGNGRNTHVLPSTQRFYKQSMAGNGSDAPPIVQTRAVVHEVPPLECRVTDDTIPCDQPLVAVQAVYDQHGRSTASWPVQVAQGETTRVKDRMGQSESQRPWLIVGMFAVILVSIVIGVVTVRCANGPCFVATTSRTPVTASPVATASIHVNTTAPTPAIPRIGSHLLIELVYDYLNNITLTRQVLSFNDTSTPEQVAVQQLLDINHLELAPDTPSKQFRWRQRYALATLLAQDSMDRLSGDECNWVGVECQSMDMGPLVGVQNAAVALNRLQSKLQGPLSADLGLLSHLVFVNVTFNDLTGSLPYSIGRWTRMESFSASANQLNGSLPASIELWTNLVHFDVGPNKLTGSLPASIGTQWPNLRYFNVLNNMMRGTLPNSIGGWTKLEYFSIFANIYWTGTLPDSIGQWTNLQYFDAARGLLTGTLPESIGAWTNLEILGISTNLLTGTLPDSIGNWTSIQRAMFNTNNFTGAVPARLCKAASLLFVTIDEDEVTCECCL